MRRELGGYNPGLKGKSGPARTGPLKMPKLASIGLELDSVEQRKLQLWGNALIGSVEAWEHRKMRRSEGRKGGGL